MIKTKTKGKPGADAPAKLVQATGATEVYDKKADTAVATTEAVSGPYEVPADAVELGYELGGTVPTQQYANVRFSVSVRAMSPRDGMDAVFANIKNWVDDRAAEIVTEINETSK